MTIWDTHWLHIFGYIRTFSCEMRIESTDSFTGQEAHEIDLLTTPGTPFISSGMTCIKGESFAWGCKKYCRRGWANPKELKPTVGKKRALMRDLLQRSITTKMRNVNLFGVWYQQIYLIILTFRLLRLAVNQGHHAPLLLCLATNNGPLWTVIIWWEHWLTNYIGKASTVEDFFLWLKQNN